MHRHEPEGKGARIFVRYDGTETRVDIHRAKEGKGLTTAELAELIDVLKHALAQRYVFDREIVMHVSLTEKQHAACLAAAEAATEEDLDPGNGGLGYHFGRRALDTDLALCGRVAHVVDCDLDNNPEYIRSDVADAAMAAAYAMGADLQDVSLAWQVSANDELASLRDKLDEATAAADAAETDRDTQRLAADDWASRFDQAAAKLAEATARSERAESALRKVRVACQYTGKNPILFVAVDVKATVDGALAGVIP